ncbi:RNA-dependent RNA polymerase [Erysiphe necator associated totivirus 4]|nr:RNA-dependent RNA polymerase [Erysiphe necator associated totivirus 4]
MQYDVTGYKQDFKFVSGFISIHENQSGTNNFKEYRLREGKIPLCVKVNENLNGRKIIAVEFRECNYVYVGQRKGIACDGETVEYLWNTAFTAINIKCMNSDNVLIYYKVDQECVPLSKHLMTVVSRHMNGLYSSINYADIESDDELFRDRLPHRADRKKVTVELLNKLPVSKVTAHHHIHFTPIEVLRALENSDVRDILSMVSLPDDASQAMGAAVVMWFGSLSRTERLKVHNMGVFKSSTCKEYVKVCKLISTEMKSVQNLKNEDLRKFFEMDVLTNRGIGEVDWQAEYEHRTAASTVKLDTDYIQREALKIFASAAVSGRSPMKMTWSKFWTNRWQWSASGSIHSQYKEDDQFIHKSDIRLKNKFISIASMPQMDMLDMAKRPKELHAWSSYKYEWGKQRAIYGTDLTSYILAQFAFYNCEEVLPDQFPVGPDATESNVSSKVAGVLKGQHAYCLDFEDFNSQHSAGAMQAVIYAYVQQFRNKLSEEQITAALWTAESIGNQVIHDNVGTKRTYRAKDTLLSGWRLTTFMNSVLNFIYTKAISEDTLKRGNSLHNGDDVLIGTKNFETIRRGLMMAKKYNVRVQSSKCAFAGIAEFLRVDHKRGSKGQYLTRGCATTTHSRIESRMSTDARDLVKSMETRFSDLHDRGASIKFIARLRQIYYERQAMICKMTVQDMYRVKTTHRVCGGVSEANDASVAHVIESSEANRGALSLPELPAVNDYAGEIKNKLEMNLLRKELIKKLRNATFEAIMEKSRTMRIVENHDEWYVNVKRIYKAHKGRISLANYGKAALVGLTVDLLKLSEEETPLVAIIRRSRRPAELLPMIT